MKYLIIPALDDLTRKMTKCDLGDFIVNGKIEAYSCKRAGQDKRTAKSLEKQFKSLASSPKLTPSSPLGPLSLPSTRKLLINLITTMNNSFPDYDFSDLRPEQFTETKVKDVIDSINDLFLNSMNSTVKGSRTEFWKVLDEVIQPEKSQVFTYKPGFGVSSKALWSANFFFYNKDLKRIVFFLVSATSKLALATSKEEAEGDLSDVEMEMEDEEDIGEKESDLERGYVDVDLLDMDDLGLEAIDMPEAKWVSTDESLGSLSSFITEKDQSGSGLGTSSSVFDRRSSSQSATTSPNTRVFSSMSSVISPSRG